jgi:hypothetical protein
MTLRKYLLVLIVASFALLPAFGAGEGAAQAPKLFAEGKALLASGDFSGAFKAFAAAAKTDPSKPEYKNHAQMVKRAVSLREMVDQGEVSPKWNKMALSLHFYYHKNKVFSEALSLDKFVHSKANSADSAAMLADTYLRLNKNGDCIALLRGIDEKNKEAGNQIPLAIALARTGKGDEACSVAAAFPVADNADVGILLDYARMYALTSQHKACAATMTKCLEISPVTQQKMIWSMVKECGDFKIYKDCPDFAKVMKTKSKVAESDCSGGSSCGSCPKRSGCGSSSDSGSDCGGCEKEKKEAPKKKTPKKDSC